MGLFKLSEKPVVTRSHRHNKIVMHHVLEKVMIRLSYLYSKVNFYVRFFYVYLHFLSVQVGGGKSLIGFVSSSQVQAGGNYNCCNITRSIFFKGVSSRFKVYLRKFKGCFKKVSRVSCLVSRVSQEIFKDVSRWFLKLSQKVSRVFH